MSMNPLQLSDEEFLNLDPETLLDSQSPEEGPNGPLSSTESADSVESAESAEDTEGDVDPEEEEAGDDTDQEEADDSDSEVTEEESAEEPDTAADTEEESAESGTENSADAESTEELSESNSDPSDEINYKAEYERLLQPFKAGGREMQVKNVDEAIQLMQMGVDYHRKMTALKPVRKTMKLLEKHGLLDEEKLSFLIDLHNKNPEAIKKLVQDAKIDPIDLDDDEVKYVPNKYEVSEQELALDEVIEQLQDTPTFNQTIDVVLNQWDERSRNIIASNPQVLAAINAHMANGIYQKVTAEVERERALGRLQGLSDIEAYKLVGDRLNEEGAFNEVSAQASKKPVVAKKVVGKAPGKEVRQKKQAASPSRSRRSSKSSAVIPPDLNPLAMSDEEFERQFKSSLL